MADNNWLFFFFNFNFYHLFDRLIDLVLKLSLKIDHAIIVKIHARRFIPGIVSRQVV